MKVNVIRRTSVGVIGTAGRDATKPMTRALWAWMQKDLIDRLHEMVYVRHSELRLVSGGAAWADHLAVDAFLGGLVPDLVLHLPAPFDGRKFIGPMDSAASAANYYHRMFSQVIGVDTLAQIDQAIEMGALTTQEGEAPGYAAFMARNMKVARDSDTLIAYTFGREKKPKDGGAAHTWSRCMGDRIHVPLPYLRERKVG